MAKRTVKRDKYGRFRGSGGIKPYKSNLAGVTRKGHGNKRKRSGVNNPVKAPMSKRKRAVIIGASVAFVAATGAAAYSNERDRTRKSRAQFTAQGRAGSRASAQVRRAMTNRAVAHATAESIIEANRLRRGNVMTGIRIRAATRATGRV